MKMKIIYLGLIVWFAFGCQKATVDPLPSWNDTQTKQQIIDFVEAVTNSSSSDYIAPKDRIATFDNDGNLWAEQPFYFQFKFSMDRIKQMAKEDETLLDDPVLKLAAEGDFNGLLHSGLEGLMKVVMLSSTGISIVEYQNHVKTWLDTTAHPKTNKPYNQMIYQPMLELLDYLRANQFTTFIVSGGGIDFLRVWAEEAYGIPPHQVVGSSFKSEYVVVDGKPMVKKLPEVDLVDDKQNKPVGINRYIGKMPVFASGNSDGDLQMLEYTASGKGKRFMLYLHHTDAEREWAYDRDSHIGKLDKGLDVAKEEGWTVIDMKKDWKVIFPFELK